MIFVVTGLHFQGFDRLVRMMDDIALKLNMKVIIQRGYAGYVPKNAESFTFKSNEEIESLYKNAEIVITHAGVGSIMSALSFGRPIIVIPRLSKYHEHKNDHQIDIANFFLKQDLVSVANNMSELEVEIKKIRKGVARFSKYEFGREKTRLIGCLYRYLRATEDALHAGKRR